MPASLVSVVELPTIHVPTLVPVAGECAEEGLGERCWADSFIREPGVLLYRESVRGYEGGGDKYT